MAPKLYAAGVTQNHKHFKQMVKLYKVQSTKINRKMSYNLQMICNKEDIPHVSLLVRKKYALLHHFLQLAKSTELIRQLT